MVSFLTSGNDASIYERVFILFGFLMPAFLTCCSITNPSHKQLMFGKYHCICIYKLKTDGVSRSPVSERYQPSRPAAVCTHPLQVDADAEWPVPAVTTTRRHREGSAGPSAALPAVLTLPGACSTPPCSTMELLIPGVCARAEGRSGERSFQS